MPANNYNTQTQNISGPINVNYPDGTTLDNCVIGATTPKAGTFTTLTSTSRTPLAPQASGATLTVTAAMAGKSILLNTAGGVTVTMPAATGTGAVYKFIVTATTTATAIKILAASTSDYLNGIAIGFTGSTAKVFASAAATNHAIQMPFAGSQPSGGFIGDVITYTDVAANLWNVEVVYQAGTTPTTPFSATNT
jgi:hypothetical protein